MFSEKRSKGIRNPNIKCQGLLLPIAAPSGTGKTTVCRKLLEYSDSFAFSVSCTTRSPRPSEKSGVDYHFVSKETFEEHIKNNMLVEWKEVFKNYYGTLRSAVEEALESCKILLLDIDVKGALSIKKLYPEDTLSIFLLPPNYEELERRLHFRGTDDKKSIALRNARIPDEVKLGEHFDHIIVNDMLSRTVEEIINIIKRR